MFDKIRSLLGHTLVYGMGNLGGRLVGFLLIPLYTRYLTPVDYGVLAMVALADQLLFILLNMGQSTALFRTYYQHDTQEARDTVLTTSLWLIAMLSLPLGLVALMLSEPLGWILTGSAQYTTWVMIGIGAMLFKTVLRLPLAVLRARGQSRFYAITSSVRTLVGFVLAIVFVVGLHWGGRGVLMSQLLAELLLAAVLVPVSLRGLSLRYSRADARDLLGYGAYLVPSALFNFVLHLSDRFFLKHWGSLGAVGLYALGYRFGEIVSFAMQALSLAWPQFLFGNRKAPDAPGLYARVFTYAAGVLAFLWLALSMLSEELVTVMAAPAFREAYRVVPVLAGAFVLEGLATIGNVGMPLYRKVKYRPAILVTAGALNVGLNLVMVPRFGAMGAAVSLCASLGLKFVLEMLVSYRLYPVPYEYWRLARLAAVAAAVYALGEGVPWGHLWAGVAGKIGLLLAMPVILYAVGFFERAELLRLRSVLRLGRRWPGALPEAPEGGR